MRTWVLLVWAALGLVACGPFDDDSGYAPQWDGTLVHYRTPTGTAMGLYSAGGLTPTLPGLEGSLQATVYQGRVWVLRPGVVSEVDPGTGEIVRDWPVSSGVGYLASGPDHLALLDTLAQALLLATPGSAGLSINAIDVGFVPRAVALQAGKWVVVGTDELRFVDGEVQRLRSGLPLNATQVLQLDPTPSAALLQGMANGQRQEWRINALAEELGTPAAATYTQRFYTPFLRADFGTEYTQTVTLASGRVAVLPFGATQTVQRTASSIAFDFTGSQLLYTVTDSLWVYDLTRGAETNLGSFSGTLLAAYPVYRYP